MRAGSSYVATAVALGLITVTGCSGAGSDRNDGPAPGEDWGDENKYPGIGGAYSNLDYLNGTSDLTNPGCAFAAGVVTVTSSQAQTIVIGKRAIDSVILVNNLPCYTVATLTVPATPANSTTMKRLVVNSTAGTANEALVLDFLNGFFAPGVASASAGSIAVDLGAGTDIVNIRATSAADTFYLGSDGIAFNADNYKDITLANAESLNVALAGGADVFTATNTGSVKGVTNSATLPVTVFGGAGNDVIVGGAAADTIYGGPGNDTLSGGAAIDTMYGEDGADIIQGTGSADGADVIDCGDESTNTSIDTVSYNLRDASITAVMGTVGGGGDAGVDGGADGGAGSSGTAGESGENDSIAINCEGITGGLQDDTLTGNANDNVLSGGPGADTITGGDGNDTLNGNEGDDTFSEGSASNGGDTFNGGAGTDTVDYSGRSLALTITMDGSSADDGADGENDSIKADVENIISGSGADDITGNTSANSITGGAGADTLNGGGGNDIFLEGSASSGADAIAGGAGTDLVDYSARTGALTVTMDGVAANDGEASEGDNIDDDVENLIGGSGADTLSGNDFANDIKGGLGADTINGLDGDDTLDGTDHTSTSANVIDCGPGDDIAYDKGDLGSYTNCEIHD